MQGPMVAHVCVRLRLLDRACRAFDRYHGGEPTDAPGSPLDCRAADTYASATLEVRHSAALVYRETVRGALCTGRGGIRLSVRDNQSLLR